MSAALSAGREPATDLECRHGLVFFSVQCKLLDAHQCWATELLVPSLVVDLPTLLECPLNIGAVYVLCFGLLAPSLLAVTSQGYHCFALGHGL